MKSANWVTKYYQCLIAADVSPWAGSEDTRPSTHLLHSLVGCLCSGNSISDLLAIHIKNASRTGESLCSLIISYRTGLIKMAATCITISSVSGRDIWRSCSLLLFSRGLWIRVPRAAPFIILWYRRVPHTSRNCNHFKQKRSLKNSWFPQKCIVYKFLRNRPK